MTCRSIDAELIRARLLEAIGKLSFEPDPALLQLIAELREREDSETARDILDSILLNAKLAAQDRIPTCQDTGSQVFFIEIGNRVQIEGPDLSTLIQTVVAEASQKYYLRRSMVKDPLADRSNSGNNLPAFIHYNVVEGDQLRIGIAQKGGGAENMSRLMMLSPGSGRNDIIEAVLQTVIEAGSKACPPLIIGIGIGANFETAPLLAKRALFRALGAPHPEQYYAGLEAEILKRVNATGIGPQGMGGNCTAVAVHILKQGCHIASLPLAVNLQCHAHRHLEIVI